MRLTKVKYKPYPARKILMEMKNLSELMVCLAYYAMVYGDADMANDVFSLEERIDYLECLLTMQASLAARDARDAESMISLFKMATATDKISDAAADIARMALYKARVREHTARVLIGGDEALARIIIGKDMEGRPLEELYNRYAHVFDVIAIRRDNVWLHQPGPRTILRENDVLIIRAPEESLVDMKLLRPPRKEEEGLSELLRDVLELKNTSELMVDLAYSSVMTNSSEIAERVLELEEYVDNLYANFERKILQAKLPTEESLCLLRVGIGTENIADAASEIAEIVVRGIKPHPVLVDIIAHSDERIISLRVPERLDGRSIESLELDKVSSKILAIRRNGRWKIKPSSKDLVKKDDVIILRCYAEAESKVRNLFAQ
ncbi:MAG: hypothetical protein DRN15_01865 [Thermoprotei archaeon]|nr:MAG: hypothetical protein DRN15_01865 [Thermoprotei archaeon]